MKLFCLLMLCFAITSKLHSQNCKALESKSLFSGIKFGDQIPSELIVCSGKVKAESSYFGVLRTQYDSLSKSCKQKYSRFFTFLSTLFSSSQITTNNKGQIYSIELYSFFDDIRKNDSLHYAPSANFVNLYNKLKALYGEPTRIEGATHTDSLFVMDLGMPRLVAWDCNKITLKLRVVYGSRVKEINIIHIQATSRDFEQIPEQVQTLQ